MACYNILILFVIIKFVSSYIVNFENCVRPSRSSIRYLSEDCTIHEVRVEPCIDFVKNKACGIKRFGNLSLSFDYTPHFQSEKLQTIGAWSKTFLAFDIPRVEKTGCRDTLCPLEPEVRRTYSTGVRRLTGKLPSKTPYSIKWILAGDNDRGCCVRFKIRLLPSDGFFN